MPFSISCVLLRSLENDPAMTILLRAWSSKGCLDESKCFSYLKTMLPKTHSLDTFTQVADMQ